MRSNEARLVHALEDLLDHAMVPGAARLPILLGPHEGLVSLVGDDVVGDLARLRHADGEATHAQRMAAQVGGRGPVP